VRCRSSLTGRAPLPLPFWPFGGRPTRRHAARGCHRAPGLALPARPECTEEREAPTNSRERPKLAQEPHRGPARARGLARSGPLRSLHAAGAARGAGRAGPRRVQPFSERQRRSLRVSAVPALPRGLFRACNCENSGRSTYPHQAARLLLASSLTWLPTFSSPRSRSYSARLLVSLLLLMLAPCVLPACAVRAHRRGSSSRVAWRANLHAVYYLGISQPSSPRSSLWRRWASASGSFFFAHVSDFDKLPHRHSSVTGD